jgi:hypothetical protein
MRKLNQAGSLLLPFIIVFVLLLSSVGFGAWAFTSRQDYKNNSDKKAAAAAAKATEAESVKKDAAFAETEKSPLKTYTGPSTYGSLTIQYPKTWSAYISENTSSGAQPVDGYFNPNFVPNVQSTGTNFALRIQVINSSYASVLKTFDSSVKAAKTSVSAYRAPKVTSILGSLVSGQVNGQKTGTMVLLPLRDKTIKVWTEGDDYKGDFMNTVLANLTFVP